MKYTYALCCFGTLFLAAGVVAEPPVVHDAGLLSGDAGIAAATSTQQDHAIARGDGQYLVAWMDTRGQSVGSETNQSGMDIFAIRLDLDGNPIDAMPFVVNSGAGGQQAPKVTWNGQQWLVTFYSQDPVGAYFGNNVRGVRIASDGTVLDTTPLMLIPGQQFWWVAGQNGQWLLTWAEYHSDGYGTYLTGRRLGNNGQFLDANATMLMDWTYLSSDNKALAANDEYLVVGIDWNTSTYKARRVGLDGRPIGSAFGVKSGNIGTNGTEYYVTWIASFSNLVGSQMTSTGVLTHPSGVLIAGGVSSYNSWDIEHDDTHWWVLWSVANLIRTARINAAGTVLDPGGVLIPNGASGSNNNCYGVQMASIPTGGVHVLWWDIRGSQLGDANVYRVPVSPGNVPGEEYVVSTGTPGQRGPGLAEGPDGRIAVAFLSEIAFEDRVLVHFLDRMGRTTTTEPIEVAVGPSFGRPAIAWNGSIYLVVWNDSSVKARRMASDGTFLDAAPIEIMPGFNVAVGALGENFLIGSARFGFTPQVIFAQARRMHGSTGALLDAQPFALGGQYVNGGMRIHEDGTRWIVTYHTQWTHNNPQSDSVYNFVYPDGTFTPASNISTNSGAAGTPDVAFSGNQYLFVWRNNSLSNANNFISGRIMNPNGSFATNNFIISEAPGRQLRPVAAWDGETFVVAWEDQRNQVAFFDERTDIYGARVSENGTVLDPAGFVVHAGPNGDAVPAILSLGENACYVASARFVLEPPYNSYRIGMTVVGVVVIPGDLDGDGDVDLADYALLFNCLQGPDVPAVPECAPFDFDGDNRVDLFDAAMFQNMFTGEQ